MWPDAPALRAFLGLASRRRDRIAAAEGAAVGMGIGLAISAMIAVVGALTHRLAEHGSVATVALVIAGALAGSAISMRRARATPVARLVEQRAPHCRNVVLTASELLDHSVRVRPYIGTVVCREAARLVAALDPATLLPARRAVGALVSTTLLSAFGVFAVGASPRLMTAVQAGSPSGSATSLASIRDVRVTVAPPSYSARPSESFTDPARIEALVGSRVRLTVRADADSLTIETIGGRQVLRAEGSPSGAQRTFVGEIVADGDGYIAIEPRRVGGTAGARRLVGLSVIPDRAPRVKLTAPGRDLFLPNGRRTIELAAEADDDIGLASLELRYTKVSGSGERFTFVDGKIPLDVSRTDARSWKARGSWRLDSLGLEAGDMLVYRAVAADNRPGAHPVESDSYIIEISAPGAVAAEGFAIDDQQDKYALSQQMVILKTERLLARSKTLAGDSLANESMGLAAEQRSVRAEFVFMMGGELAEEVLAAAGLGDLNEEAEARGEEDLAAGRMANQGRIDLVRAIRSMSHASTSLNTADLAEALKEEKAALTYLQRAFARARYILRALTQRERLDLSRRMTGELSAVGRESRPTVEPEADPQLAALRATLAGIASLAGEARLPVESATRATGLAERLLRIDPSDERLQRVAARLSESATAIANGRTDAARRLLDGAALDLVAVARVHMSDSPARGQSIEAGLLDGALTEALRQRRGMR